VPSDYQWRIRLRCEHVYLIDSTPDLSRPLMCSAPGHDPALCMIWQAERIPPAAPPDQTERLASQPGR
jgi:hypothetical protein